MLGNFTDAYITWTKQMHTLRGCIVTTRMHTLRGEAARYTISSTMTNTFSNFVSTFLYFSGKFGTFNLPPPPSTSPHTPSPPKSSTSHVQHEQAMMRCRNFEKSVSCRVYLPWTKKLERRHPDIRLTSLSSCLNCRNYRENFIAQHF